MTTISWISTSGGDWSSGANWQGGSVPGAADDAVMNLSVAETITISTAQPIHSVNITDNAAAFVLTSSGTLDAAGDVTLNVGSIVLDGSIISGGALDVNTSGTAVINYTAGPATAVVATDNGNGGISVVALACFARGTRIATPGAETRVETLAAGDLVCLANGNTAPITWIGHRRVACRRHPRPASVCPVRIRRGAFAADVPRRDLILSPDHAIFCDGVLIPVRLLVNGDSIVQEAPDEITYYHLELPRHDVILAEGLPVESYLETGGRDAFSNADVVRLFADFGSDRNRVSRLWDAHAAAPLVVAGPVLERIATALRRRASCREPVRPHSVQHCRTAPRVAAPA